MPVRKWGLSSPGVGVIERVDAASSRSAVRVAFLLFPIFQDITKGRVFEQYRTQGGGNERLKRKAKRKTVVTSVATDKYSISSSAGLVESGKANDCWVQVLYMRVHTARKPWCLMKGKDRKALDPLCIHIHSCTRIQLPSLNLPLVHRY